MANDSDVRRDRWLMCCSNRVGPDVARLVPEAQQNANSMWIPPVAVIGRFPVGIGSVPDAQSSGLGQVGQSCHQEFPLLSNQLLRDGRSDCGVVRQLWPSQDCTRGDVRQCVNFRFRVHQSESSARSIAEGGVFGPQRMAVCSWGHRCRVFFLVHFQCSSVCWIDYVVTILSGVHSCLVPFAEYSK